MTPANTAVELELESPGRRNRATVAFRALLALPQSITAYVLSLAASGVVIVGWFAALVTGYLPDWARTFVADCVAYQARVMAYRYLLVDQYPPFAFTSSADTSYPVQLDMPAKGRLDRGAVAVRLFMSIPAGTLLHALLFGWLVVGLFVWLAVLIIGRTPQSVFDAVSAMLRYQARFNAWFYMLTDAYPKELFGDKQPTTVQRSATRPLIFSAGGRRLMITLAVVGAVAYVGYIVANHFSVLPAMVPRLVAGLLYLR